MKRLINHDNEYWYIGSMLARSAIVKNSTVEWMAIGLKPRRARSIFFSVSSAMAWVERITKHHLCKCARLYLIYKNLFFIKNGRLIKKRIYLDYPRVNDRINWKSRESVLIRIIFLNKREWQVFLEKPNKIFTCSYISKTTLYSYVAEKNHEKVLKGLQNCLPTMNLKQLQSIIASLYLFFCNFIG